MGYIRLKISNEANNSIPCNDNFINSGFSNIAKGREIIGPGDESALFFEIIIKNSAFFFEI